MGGRNGWIDNAWAVVASRLVEQGVVVTISAGNDGSDGPFAASNGASGEYVVAVASVEATTVPLPSFKGTFSLGSSTNASQVAYNTNDPWSDEKIVRGIVPLWLGYHNSR